MNNLPELTMPSDLVAREDARLRVLLDEIVQISSADCAGVYAVFENTREPVVLVCAPPNADHGAETDARLHRLLREFRNAHSGDARPTEVFAFSPEVWDAAQLGRLPYKSALLVPLYGEEQMVGALGVFARSEDAFSASRTDEYRERLRLHLEAVRLHLENAYLAALLEQNVAAAQSILVTAQEIAENPSPQHVVNILHDILFGAQVSSCAILLYGPVREDNPSGPFDYLEIKGTWSKRFGSGVANGVRLYVKDFPEVLRRLDEEKVLIFSQTSAIRSAFDPLIRSFIRAERIRSMALLALGSASRKIGVLVVGFDKPHEFTPRELHNYRTVTEFLAINAMAQQLQQQRDRVQQGRAALLDAVTDGVVMVLPGGYGGYVLTVNQRFTRLFEVPESRVQGLTLIDLLRQMRITEQTRGELRTAWSSMPVLDPSTKRGEFSMISRDGKPMEIEWYSAPVYQDGRVLGRIYIFHDASAEREAARLRANFLSRVSHELRTPLTSISGFAEFILEATGDQLPDLAREYTQIILSSARHLSRIFTDMIEITRAGAGEMTLHKADHALAEIIRDAAARLELQFNNRGQTLLLELDDHVPVVNVDYDRIVQVFTNLLGNAGKYAPENSTIRVTLTLAQQASDLGEDAPRDVMLPAAFVTILDEGSGIPTEDVDKVFLPFYRTREARANKIEGTGLGLAVTRSIIEVHRGKIWAVPTAKAGGGCFRLTIPISLGNAGR